MVSIDIFENALILISLNCIVLELELVLTDSLGIVNGRDEVSWFSIVLQPLPLLEVAFPVPDSSTSSSSSSASSLLKMAEVAFRANEHI